MIDPINITKFNQTQPELEEAILFWVCAAGKNGVTAARCLDKLLSHWRISAKMLALDPSPFDIIRHIHSQTDLANELKRFGIGCYKGKARTFLQLVWSRLDLKTCDLDDLEDIDGIGPKTARCFLIHSRPDQQYAGLDTHILKYLRDCGYEVPKSTPTGRKYRELEAIFLDLAQRSGKSVAEFDLEIWNQYRSRNENKSSYSLDDPSRYGTGARNRKRQLSASVDGR